MRYKGGMRGRDREGWVKEGETTEERSRVSSLSAVYIHILLINCVSSVYIYLKQQ